MAEIERAEVRVIIDTILRNAIDNSVTRDPLLIRGINSLADGTGANQAQDVWHDERTLALSTDEDLDLNGATLLNAFGEALAFTKVKALIVIADADNTNDVQVKPGAANGFLAWCGAATHTINIPPGGMFVITAPDVDGFAVAAGTADLLNVANGGAGTAVTYNIVVIGV